MVTPSLQMLDARRRSLGMSNRILARRAGVSEPTVVRILSGRERRPHLANVEAIARALGAEVSLSFPVDAVEFRKQRAFEKARRLVGMTQATMGLESQAVDEQTVDTLVEETATLLITGPRLRLWED